MKIKKSGSHKDRHSETSTPLRRNRNRKHETIINRVTKNYKIVFASAVVVAFTAGVAFGGSMVEPETMIVEKEVEKQVIVPQTIVYAMTDAERYEVASVVQAEAGGEPYAGKLAVAQCIFQAVKDEGSRPVEAIKNHGYTKNRPEPSEDAYKAVDEVFLYGRTVTVEPIKYFYAPARTQSDWHESQKHVLTINGHRFFKENKGE